MARFVGARKGRRITATMVDSATMTPAMAHSLRGIGSVRPGVRAGRSGTFSAKHGDLDVAAFFDELVHDGATQQTLPQRTRGFSKDDAGNIPRTGVVKERVGRPGRGECNGLGPELLGQPQGSQNPLSFFPGTLRETRCFHEGDDPLRAEPLRHAACGTDQLGRERARTNGHHQALGDRPGGADGVFPAVIPHLGVDAFGSFAQREFPQGNKIAGAKEIAHGPLRLVGNVDLAFLQALQQSLDGEVDELDLVGCFHHRIRNRLPHMHAGHLRDDVVQAIQMLHIQGGEDVDTGAEELLDVFPALGVAGAGDVGVRQLVHQDQFGPAGEGGVQVEFG